MSLQVQEVGNEKHKVIIIDDFIQEPHRLIDMAHRMGGFEPDPARYYPGLKRFFFGRRP